MTRNGIQVLAFPALIDEGDTVGIGLFDNVELAAVQHQLGLTRLLRITHAKQLRRLVRELSGFDSAKWLMGRWLSSAELEVCLECVLVKMAIESRSLDCRDEKSFRQIQQSLTAAAGVASHDVGKWLPELAERINQVDLLLSEMKTNNRFIKTFNDARNQARRLLASGFLADVPWRWLEHYPRYLKGLAYRLERVDAGSQSIDLERMQLVRQFDERYQQQQEKLRLANQADPELENYRWLIEEYRISLFAQPLGTSQKVSPQRLDKQWSLVRANI